jgi:hypothetical protein
MRDGQSRIPLRSMRATQSYSFFRSPAIMGGEPRRGIKAQTRPD